MTLVPPAPEDGVGALGVDAESLEDNIVYAVADLRNAIAEAAVDQPKFFLKEGGVEIEFVATKEGSLSLLASGEHKDEVTHTMTLTLGRKSELGKKDDKALPLGETVRASHNRVPSPGLLSAPGG